MDAKAGYHLTKWEIKQRLLKENIAFDGLIQSKDYYIALYNRLIEGENEDKRMGDGQALQEPINKEKEPRRMKANLCEDEVNDKARSQVTSQQSNGGQTERIVFTKPPFKRQQLELELEPTQRDDNSKSSRGRVGSMCLVLGVIVIAIAAVGFMSRGIGMSSEINSNFHSAQAALSNTMNYLSRLNPHDVVFIALVLFFTLLLILLFKFALAKSKKSFKSNEKDKQ